METNLLRQGRRSARSSSTLGLSRSFPSKYNNLKSTNMMGLFASCPERALRSIRRGSSKWALANSWFTALNTCTRMRSQQQKLFRFLLSRGQQRNGAWARSKRRRIARENSGWCPVKSLRSPVWTRVNIYFILTFAESKGSNLWPVPLITIAAYHLWICSGSAIW